MDVYQKALQLHKDLAGKIEVVSRAEINAVSYTHL